MSLRELFAEEGAEPSLPDLTVGGITLDSRLVAPGDLYVALPGTHHHGAEYAAQAAAAGAAAILTDAPGGLLAQGSGLPVVVVDHPRHGMAVAAAAIYGRPAEAMSMLAVTGTNGKTTTTFLLESALRAAGLRTGLVGTVGFRFEGAPIEAARTTITTPESTELQALLGYLRDQGAQAVLMEVSSHALVLGRADAIHFAVAGFTNLGRDHLDFHGDEASYFEAKASLFTAERVRQAVVNVDDQHGRVLVQRIEAAGEPGLTTVSLSGAADVRALDYETTADRRTRVRASVHGRTVDFALTLPGEFNVRNALTALAMADLVGADLLRAADGLSAAYVPGRMQRVEVGAGAPVIYVDFAHTPQAVSAALGALSGQGRLIAVLGCGGDRDTEKRTPMGQAAALAADVVVVTDDNPRSEDPVAIRAQVLAGALAVAGSHGRNVEVIDGGDRRAAIGVALRLGGPEDVVAILGKGHEPGQETAGTVLPFSDPDVAVEEWQALLRQRRGARR